MRTSKFESLYSGLRFNFRHDQLIKVEHPEYLACAKYKTQGFIDKTVGNNLPVSEKLAINKLQKNLITFLETKDICALEEICKPRLKPS